MVTQTDAEADTVGEGYIQSIAVAAVDILAVRRLVVQPDECRSVMRVLSKFVKNASARWAYTSPDLSAEREAMYSAEIYFGDSVYLFADHERDLQHQVLWLSARVATLIAIGLTGETSYLTRAAISVGDLRTRVVRSDGDPHEIRIGTAMVRAHELQESQDWIGGAVDLAVPRHDDLKNWTIDYPVALKESRPVASSPIALNWIGAKRSRDGIEKALVQSIELAGRTSSAEKKLENTMRFVRAVCDVGKYAPFEWPEG